MFFGGEVDISPKKTDLVNNQASATIMSGSDKDFRLMPLSIIRLWI